MLLCCCLALLYPRHVVPCGALHMLYMLLVMFCHCRHYCMSAKPAIFALLMTWPGHLVFTNPPKKHRPSHDHAIGSDRSSSLVTVIERD